MKKLIMLGIAASVVIGGATVHAQRIPGKGLQQTAYLKPGQVSSLVGCGVGGCATQPMDFGGCTTETRVGCGESAPIPCCPLSGLRNIPPIIPSIQMPDCGSPIVAPCVGGVSKLGSVVESIGRAFARSEYRSECKPDCAVPAPVTAAPCAIGECRIQSPGVACLGDGFKRGLCTSGSCRGDACQSGSCNDCRCRDCKCDDGQCENGRCEAGDCDDLSGSVCSGLGDTCCGGVCGNGLCGAGGCCRFGYPDRGWNMPVKTPITRNPVSYTRYQPGQLYGSPGSGYGSSFPMIYRPTDTTQLGFIGQNVPYWRRGRGPGMPPPSAIHSRNCPAGGYTTFGQGYNHNSHQSYPWFQHHLTNANGTPSPAANIAARQPVRRPVMVPGRPAGQRPVMQAGFRRTPAK